MRRTTAAWVLAAGLCWPGAAEAQDRVTAAMLLANPSAYDDRDVVIAGVVGAQQWVNVTVLGNPPYQGWFPAFLLSDGQASIWVVVRAGSGSRAVRSTAGFGVPPAGAQIDVYGRFWAVSNSIEMDRPYVLLR